MAGTRAAEAERISDADDWARGTSLYLEVNLNGSPTGQLVHFDDRGGKLYASVASLRELGFVLPADTKDPLPLASLDGVVADYDVERQQVAIRAPLRLLDLKTARLNEPEYAPSASSSASGWVLNYDLYATRGARLGGLAADTELRAFAGAAGVLSNTAISRVFEVSNGSWRGETRRLDTDWRLSFPDTMLQLTLGDTTTGALAWTRSTRIGGIAIARDFALQPYRLTTPLPAFFGEAVLPSTLDLYVDGMRQYSSQVPAGPYQLTTIPTINGVGLAQIVMTDAFGRSTTTELAFYSTRDLLQKGLSDWSFELGFVRRNYGLTSFDYAGKPMTSGSLRYGLTDALTLEAHGEGTSGLVNGGIGGELGLGLAGVLTGSIARSEQRGESGSQANLGWRWTNSRLSFAIDSTRTRADYRDVAALYGPAPPRVSERAITGFNTRTAGTFGLSYLRQKYPAEEESRYAGAYWSQSFGGHLSLNLTVNQNLDRSEDRSIFFGVAYTLANHASVNAGVNDTRGTSAATLDVNRPVPGDGGFGWRTQVRSGNGNGADAQVSWLDNHGQLTVGASSFGSTYAYADATGALIWIGGHAFAARRIDDAFAVVSTDGIAGVPVKLENRVIGRTEGDGVLLISRLESYQRNQISIDPMDLPADLRITRVDAPVAPGYHAGALVRFDITPIRAASLILVDADGRPLPLGSSVHREGEAHSVPVGFDGLVYLEALQAHNRLRVETPEGDCRVQFDFSERPGTLAQIGPLPCRKDPKP